MSDLVVEVVAIDAVNLHPNADKLELAIVKGWQVVVGKGEFTAGDKVVYVPPDAVLPVEVSDHLGVTKYLSHQRVRAVKLRKEPSFGFVFRPDGFRDVGPDTPIGDDVAERFGITKYDPPPVLCVGDNTQQHPMFHKYTDIQNLRNWPHVFDDGEAVVITEKIHGTNSRVGSVLGTLAAGSHNLQKADPGEELWKSSTYWYPMSLPQVRSLIMEVAAKDGVQSVILFGEIYGKVQELRYGHPNDLAYAAFDLAINGQYVDVEAFEDYCDRHGVTRVPVLSRTSFSMEAVKAVASGPSTVPGATNVKEGCVIKPVKDRNHVKIGRVVLKYIGDEYMLSKGFNANKDV